MKWYKRWYYSLGRVLGICDKYESLYEKMGNTWKLVEAAGITHQFTKVMYSDVVDGNGLTILDQLDEQLRVTWVVLNITHPKLTIDELKLISDDAKRTDEVCKMHRRRLYAEWVAFITDWFRLPDTDTPIRDKQMLRDKRLHLVSDIHDRLIGRGYTSTIDGLLWWKMLDKLIAHHQTTQGAEEVTGYRFTARQRRYVYKESLRIDLSKDSDYTFDNPYLRIQSRSARNLLIDYNPEWKPILESL
nr:MAG TPA: hypothetical protein [Caudoviricetes sp.]